MPPRSAYCTSTSNAWAVRHLRTELGTASASATHPAAAETAASGQVLQASPPIEAQPTARNCAATTVPPQQPPSPAEGRPACRGARRQQRRISCSDLLHLWLAAFTSPRAAPRLPGSPPTAAQRPPQRRAASGGSRRWAARPPPLSPPAPPGRRGSRRAPAAGKGAAAALPPTAAVLGPVRDGSRHDGHTGTKDDPKVLRSRTPALCWEAAVY